MTLGELLYDLEEPDHVPVEVDAMKLEVEFCTSDKGGMTLLSVYYSYGAICIDVGGDNE